MSSKSTLVVVALTAFMFGLACSQLAASKMEKRGLDWQRKGKTVSLKAEKGSRYLVVGAYPEAKEKGEMPPVRYVSDNFVFRGGEEVTVFELVPQLQCRYGNDCVPCRLALDCPVPPIPPLGPVPLPYPGPKPGPRPTGDSPWAVWPAP